MDYHPCVRVAVAVVVVEQFILIKAISKMLKMTIKVQLIVVRGDVEKVLNQISIALAADSLDELTEAEIADHVNKAGGAG
jgi:hypothetical protein